MSKKLAKTTRHISWQSKLTQHPNMVKAKFTRHQLKTWPKLTYFGWPRVGRNCLTATCAPIKHVKRLFFATFFLLPFSQALPVFLPLFFCLPPLQLNCRQIFYLVSKKSQQLKITNQHFSSRFVSFFCMVFVVILPLG